MLGLQYPNTWLAALAKSGIFSLHTDNGVLIGIIACVQYRQIGS